MKIALIIVRTLLGLLFLFSSLAFFLKLVPTPELKGNVKLFMDGMIATGYLLNLIKITELTCAISFITGRFTTLATVVIFPVSLNILLYHIFVSTVGLPIAIFVVAANLFIAYNYRKNYTSLFAVK